MTDETSTSENYLSTTEVAERYSVAKSTIYSWRKHSDFPKPIKLNGSTARWPVSTLEDWESRQAMATA